MDKDASWLRWIADHSVYGFWTIWGAGAGATLAILCGAADVGADVLRVYLAILTAMMGGVFGLVSSRVIDSRADRRRIRRKLYSAKTRTMELAHELVRLQGIIDEIRKAKSVAPNGENLTHEEATRILIRCDRIYARSESPPDFEDLVENEVDSTIEFLCRSNFIFCRGLYGIGKLQDLDTDERRQKAAGMLETRPMGEHSAGRALQAVIDHLNLRLGQA